jgi:hypothetical protein
MLIKINRQDCIHQFPKLPLREYNPKEEEYDFYFPGTVAGYNLTVASKSFRGHVKLLGTALTNLTTELGFDKLIFLGDLDLAWLYRNHDFKPAKEGLKYLTDNKIGKRFNGGLQVDTTELPTFIEHLAWLVRSNAILQTVHFTDPKQHIIGSICQYGNLHIYTTNKKADNLFPERIATSRLEYLPDNICYNKFSKSSAIKGRQITL